LISDAAIRTATIIAGQHGCDLAFMVFILNYFDKYVRFLCFLKIKIVGES